MFCTLSNLTIVYLLAEFLPLQGCLTIKLQYNEKEQQLVCEEFTISGGKKYHNLSSVRFLKLFLGFRGQYR